MLKYYLLTSTPFGTVDNSINKLEQLQHKFYASLPLLISGAKIVLYAFFLYGIAIYGKSAFTEAGTKKKKAISYMLFAYVLLLLLKVGPIIVVTEFANIGTTVANLVNVVVNLLNNILVFIVCPYLYIYGFAKHQLADMTRNPLLVEESKATYFSARVILIIAVTLTLVGFLL